MIVTSSPLYQTIKCFAQRSYVVKVNMKPAAALI